MVRRASTSAEWAVAGPVSSDPSLPGANKSGYALLVREWRSTGGALICALASLCWCGTAVAQAGGDDERAREVYTLGKLAAEEGRWEDAEGYFERAYELSDRPEMLYNIAVAREHMGARDEAIETFEAYLRARPDAPNRPGVEERISVLRATDDRPPVRESQIIQVYEPDAGAGPWILVGSGAGMAAAGVVFLLLADSAKSTVEETAAGTRYWEEVSGDADRASVLSIVGGVVLGVGIASAGVGLTWLLIGDGGGSTEAEVSLSPGRLSLRGRF